MAMTIAAEHPHTRSERRHGVALRVRSYHPLGVASLGFITAIIGAWAGIAAFVGPDFNYSVTSTTRWEWTAANALLHLWPGVVALVAGLIYMMFAEAGSRISRSVIRFSVLAAMAAGAWLVVGPALWPVFESSPAYVTQNTASMDFWMRFGSSLGPGLLIVAIGGLVFSAISGRAPIVEPAPAATATGVPPTGARETEAVQPHPTEQSEKTGATPATGTQASRTQLP